MQSVGRTFLKCLTANIMRSSGALQLKAASSSSASVPNQVENTLLHQLCDQLVSWHIPVDDIKKTVEQHPSLLRYPPSQWNSLYNTLINFGFKKTHFLKMVALCPALLTTDQKDITEVWNALSLFRLSTDYLTEVISRKPKLLCTTPQNVEEKAHAILNFVGYKNNSLQVLTNCDNVFALSLEELKEVINYVQDEMKVKRKYEICRSRVVECPVAKLKMRHMFLVDCGRYAPVDDDIPTTIPHSNPLLRVIVDSSDEVFAVKAATVTLEEYMVYQDLWEKRVHEEIYDFSDDE